MGAASPCTVIEFDPDFSFIIHNIPLISISEGKRHVVLLYKSDVIPAGPA